MYNKNDSDVVTYYLSEKYLFLKNNATSEGANSNNEFYSKQLPISRNQVSFYVNDFFE